MTAAPTTSRPPMASCLWLVSLMIGGRETPVGNRFASSDDAGASYQSDTLGRSEGPGYLGGSVASGKGRER